MTRQIFRTHGLWFIIVLQSASLCPYTKVELPTMLRRSWFEYQRMTALVFSLRTCPLTTAWRTLNNGFTTTTTLRTEIMRACVHVLYNPRRVYVHFHRVEGTNRRRTSLKQSIEYLTQQVIRSHNAFECNLEKISAHIHLTCTNSNSNNHHWVLTHRGTSPHAVCLLWSSRSFISFCYDIALHNMPLLTCIFANVSSSSAKLHRAMSYKNWISMHFY